MKAAVPYGSWTSPITTTLVLASTIALGDSYSAKTSPTPRDSPAIFWIEQRPEQGGRNAIVTRGQNGAAEEVIPDVKYNARTRVHEYGGNCVTVISSEEVVFSSVEGPVMKVLRAEGKWGTPTVVSPEGPYRYADLQQFPSDPTLLLAIQEDHTNDSPASVVNTLVVLSTTTRKVTPLVSGTDFYSSARFSPDGCLVSWIQWAHPDMPWEGCELYVAKIARGSSGSLEVVKGSEVHVAGAAKGVESVSQARWVPGGAKLLFLSDRSGFYELYEWTSEQPTVRLVLSEATGSDMGGPDWMIGQTTHESLSSTHTIAVAPKGQLRLIDLANRSSKILATPFQSISNIEVVSSTSFLVTGSPATKPTSLVLVTIGKDDTLVMESIKNSSAAEVDEGYISSAQSITYPTKAAKGEEDNQVAHAKFYEPTSTHSVGVAGTLPPLIVRCHGGPTSAARSGLDWLVQFFTSRGYAFVDVNYGGSTGYGKKFRQRLEGNWGLVDVDDTIACVEYLAKEGKVDAARVAITGGSAGGFTVLAALCASKVFGAGTSSYGVSDLALLAGDTHKFESQYLFGLLGGTPAKVPDVYASRSPINNASHITAPMLFLQGDEDKVVPPEQATIMAEKIIKNGGQAEIVIFKGEGHGFRRAENRKRAMELELGFYERTFGIVGSKD